MEEMRNPSCPNCRGSATIIAVWNFIGPRPDPTQGQPNLYAAGSLDGNVQLTALATPRSMATDYDFTTPDGIRVTSEHTTPEGNDNGQAFPTFPSSAQDAQDWWESSITVGTTQNNPATRKANVSKAVTAACGNGRSHVHQQHRIGR